MTNQNYNDIKTRLDGVLTTFDSEVERILTDHSKRMDAIEAERDATLQTRIHDAFTAFLAADNTWSSELQNAFGSRAGDVRYTKAGESLPGYAAFKSAGETWRALIDLQRAE